MMFRRVKQALRALHQDQVGAGMVEYVLILAAVALPLLGVLVYFWDGVKTWVFELFDGIRNNAENAGAVS